MTERRPACCSAVAHGLPHDRSCPLYGTARVIRTTKPTPIATETPVVHREPMPEKLS